MIKCKDCIFWGVIPEGHRFNWSKGWKDHQCCGSGKFIYDRDYEFEATAIPIDSVGYADGEAYQADLWTGRDFGCIHGRKKGEDTS